MVMCELKLKKLGLFDYFEIFVLSEDLGLYKSDIKVYEIAKERMNKGKVEKIVHVGDSLELDVYMAQKVGMIPILFDPHELHPNKDVITITKFPELLKNI